MKTSLSYLRGKLEAILVFFSPSLICTKLQQVVFTLFVYINNAVWGWWAHFVIQADFVAHFANFMLS